MKPVAQSKPRLFSKRAGEMKNLSASTASTAAVRSVFNRDFFTKTSAPAQMRHHRIHGPRKPSKNTILELHHSNNPLQLTTGQCDSSSTPLDDQDYSVRGNMEKLRVLLADDHEAILAQVRIVLGEEFNIVGAVNNGRDAIVEVQRLDPDVLVIDISMPILNGLQAVSQLRSNRRTKVVFLTVHKDQDFVEAAFSAGASAYVVKADVTTDLVPAIRDALEGRRYISQSITS
jgi:CheY-like chemotaxis protein